MAQISARLGFDYFAITHHVPDPFSAGMVNLSNFPQDWEDRVTQENYWHDNPIMQVSRRSVASFAWADLIAGELLNPRQMAIMQDAATRGLANGFTVPANMTDGISGCVSFAVQGNKPLPEDRLALSHYLGCFSYEAALRIGATQPSARSQLLSQRQLECIVQVARGKSDWEAGIILGISKETVHKHVQTAMSRLGVSTRTQLVVRALYGSQLTFGDLIEA